ncbi:MAG: hypothetical protein M3N82_00430, partial [Pseudomonadota bacterium]|nr:hypothetical protein [Pseudomonadota bacterium]
STEDENNVYPGADGSSNVCVGGNGPNRGCSLHVGTHACVGTQCFVTGPYTETGKACVGGSAPADPTSSACAKQGMGVGQVNGVSVCVPATKSGTSTVTTNTSTSAASGSGNGTVSSSIKTTDVNNNGDGTTTTTTTKTNSDGSSSVTSSTVPTATQAGADANASFCKQNPNASICKSSAFGGSCGASFTCDGDAVQCAIAKEQHIRACQVFEPLTAGGEIQTDAQRGEQARADGLHPPGSPTDPAQASETVMNWQTQIDETNPFASECPGDYPLGSFAGKVLALPLSSYCSQFQLIGKFVLAITTVACLAIIFKG